MDQPGEHTIAEILQQPAAWKAALTAVRSSAPRIRRLFHDRAAEPLLLIGCGSPYYLAESAAVLMRTYAGLRCLATPASELIFHPRSLISEHAQPLLLIFSRSGETSEAIAAARLAQQLGGKVLAVGCDKATTLLRLADLAIEIPEGRESSATQTRSFAGMFVAAQAIVSQLATRHASGSTLHAVLEALPSLGTDYIDRARETVASLAADAAIERIFVLGSGTRFGLACEAALKFQEMSLTMAQAFHTLEFRHGPMSLVGPGSLVIGLLDDDAAGEEAAVLRESEELGARLVILAEQSTPELASIGTVLAFNSGLPSFAYDVLYLPPLQLMAYQRAMAKGLDPDAPPNVSPFIRRPSIEVLAQ